MSMNSFSLKLDWQQALAAMAQAKSKSKTKTKSKERSEQTITRTLTKLDGLFNETSQESRDESQQAVDLSHLKKTYSDVPGLGRRAAPRFPVQLSVIAFAANQISFRTESLNISASGALLKDSLPSPFMKGTFEIMFVVKNPESGQKTQLLFKARAVGVGTKTPRITFESTEPRALRCLETLFAGLDPLL